MSGAVTSLRLRSAGCAVWAILLLLPGGFALAQDSGSPDPPENPDASGEVDPPKEVDQPEEAVQSKDLDPPAEVDPPQSLNLDRLDAFLEFEGEFGYTKIETPNRSRRGRDRTQRNREWGFEERIGLELGGWAIDPRILTFGGQVSFALTQDRYEEKVDSLDRSDRDSGHSLEYDLRANLFPGRKTSGSAYGLRREDRIPRRFQPTLNQQRTGFGTSWLLSDDKFPMELSYDYLETDRTGNADRSDDEHYTEQTFRYSVERLMSESHRLRFSYEHGNTKQDYQGLPDSFETTRDLFRIEHELEFGEKKRNSLRTLVHWQEESGDFARDFFEAGPQLTLHHSENLQTLYKYQFNRERYAGLDVETHRADFQIVHQMYTNLTTTLDVFGLYEDVEDDINTTQYGASVDWQYNRRNRHGHLYGNLALAVDREDVDGDNGVRVVLDEAHAFDDPFQIILRNRNAIPGTIVVTDTTNRRFFRIGADYAVLRNGNVTRIARIQTGQIADGDTVLVDYQIRTPADGRLDTVRVDFSLEQRFPGGVTPYYRWSFRNQEDDTSTGFFRRADRTDHHRLGIKYEGDRFSLGTELEIYDDTIEPYDAFHVSGMVHILRGLDRSLDLSTRFSRLFFEGGYDDRNVTMIDVSLDHRWRLTDTLSTIERVAYRFEDDSVAGDTHAWDVTAGLEYVVGDLSGELTFEYDRLDLPGSQENDFGVFFRVRREFPNVLAR